MKAKIRLFETELALYETAALRGKEKANSYTLVLYPAGREIEKIKKRNFDWKPACLTHVTGAIGFLEFTARKHGLVVCGIQSDIFGKLPSPLRKRYENWAEIMLLALEDHARALDIPTIYVTTTWRQMEIWNTLFFHPPLAYRNYTHIERKLGYTLCTTEQHEDHFMLNGVAWRKDVAQQPGVKFI